MKITKLLPAGLALALALVFVTSATPADAARKFPWKPIRVIVALGAGGSHDMNSRAVASVANDYFGQPMIVQLMPGGGGKIGMTALKRAKPDGHTIMLASASHLTIGPHVRNMGYDPLKDFVPIFMINKADYMMVSPASKPWKNFKEFAAAARKNPGKVSYGSSGIYGTGHLMILKIMADTGIKLNHIPFKGGGPAFRAMLGGHVDSAGALPATGGTLGRYRRGQLNILGVCSEKRVKLFPKVPTMKENGVDFLLASKRFYIGPKGIPQDRVDFLVEGFKKLLKNKSYLRLISKMGEVPTPLYGEALKKDLADEYERFGKIFASIGVKKK